jgi:hypothetical protein
MRRLVFSSHALKRMAQRGLSAGDIEDCLDLGEIIASYDDDTPHPSRLMSGWVGGRCIHVVAAEDRAAGMTIIVTVYRPDPRVWEPGFRRKRR